MSMGLICRLNLVEVSSILTEKGTKIEATERGIEEADNNCGA